MTSTRGTETSNAHCIISFEERLPVSFLTVLSCISTISSGGTPYLTNSEPRSLDLRRYFSSCEET
jgi:hypothetical protein